MWPSELLGHTWKIGFLEATTNIVAAAREFNMPELLKRAFYEFLCNPSFWEAISANRKGVNLADTDLIRLYHARHVLQQEWNTLVLTPPMPGEKCPTLLAKKPCTFITTKRRKVYWRSHFVDTGELEKGGADLIAYANIVLEGPLFKVPDETWCKACLDERTEVWQAARNRWWDMLDGLFEIEVVDADVDGSVV